MNILLVDDEDRNLRVLEGMLRPFHYELLKAQDGESALKVLKEKDVDLVLLDIMMPGISGLEVLKNIREDDRLKTLPVLLVTALSERENKVAGLNAGADDYVSKPFDQEELLARVNTQMKLSYFRRQLNEKEQFEYVVNHISNGLLILDGGLKIVRINQKARELLGITGEDADWAAYIERRFRISYEGDFFKDLTQKELLFDIERTETDTERPLILESNSSIIKNPAGEVSHIVLLFKDVTEERKRQFQEQSFLDLISHKLRTPMTIISGNIDLLQDGIVGPLNAEQKDLMGVLAKKSGELTDAFEKMIGYVTICGPKIEPGEAPVQVRARLEELVKKLIRSSSREAPEVHWEFLSEPVELDIVQLYFDLIFKNLLENAFKFNSKEKPGIWISAKKKDGALEITVKDDGEGIPGEDIEKVFDVFYQVDKHRTGNIPGYGLGLAIVRHLVQGIGGTIQIKSEVGKGSAFILTLPVRSSA